MVSESFPISPYRLQFLAAYPITKLLKLTQNESGVKPPHSKTFGYSTTLNADK